MGLRDISKYIIITFTNILNAKYTQSPGVCVCAFWDRTLLNKESCFLLLELSIKRSSNFLGVTCIKYTIILLNSAKNKIHRFYFPENLSLE